MIGSPQKWEASLRAIHKSRYLRHVVSFYSNDDDSHHLQATLHTLTDVGVGAAELELLVFVGFGGGGGGGCG